MKKPFGIGLLALVGLAHTDEYSRKVYCDSGATYVTVLANSEAETAAKLG